MGSSVAFTSEELYSGDNPAIIASAQAENRLAKCLRASKKESERVASLSARPETVRAKYAASLRALVLGGLRPFV
jgi:hypothetical protein